MSGKKVEITLWDEDLKQIEEYKEYLDSNTCEPWTVQEIVKVLFKHELEKCLERKRNLKMIKK